MLKCEDLRNPLHTADCGIRGHVPKDELAPIRLTRRFEHADWHDGKGHVKWDHWPRCDGGALRPSAADSDSFRLLLTLESDESTPTPYTTPGPNPRRSPHSAFSASSMSLSSPAFPAPCPPGLFRLSRSPPRPYHCWTGLINGRRVAGERGTIDIRSGAIKKEGRRVGLVGGNCQFPLGARTAGEWRLSVPFRGEGWGWWARTASTLRRGRGNTCTGGIRVWPERRVSDGRWLIGPSHRGSGNRPGQGGIGPLLDADGCGCSRERWSCGSGSAGARGVPGCLVNWRGRCHGRCAQGPLVYYFKVVRHVHG